MQKKWKISLKAPRSFQEKFPEYSPLALQLLYERGLKTQEAIDKFFNPDYNEDLHDPFLLKDIKPTLKRIFKAVKNKEKITIYADYDADGICSGAILWETLKKLGARLDIYIPDRNKEGYGLNPEAIKILAKKKTELIITVDCGVSNKKEVELARKEKIDVIIIDHHHVPKDLPRACAIVNPKQKDCKYPFKELAAAGVVFKVIQAIIANSKANSFDDGFEKWLLDLVATATVADCVTLMGENRTLVKYGLYVLAKTRRLGLKELMEVAGIFPRVDPDAIECNLNTFTLGFQVGPRLNAAGRMNHAAISFKLLITKDITKAKKLVSEIDRQNKDRQKLTDKIVKEVKTNIDPKSFVILAKSSSWLTGLVGLVAGKITEEFCRPTLIFNQEKGICRGSGRSIPGFNLIEALEQCSSLLLNFGGHAGAAGSTLNCKNFKNFQEKLEKIARKSLKKEDFIPQINIAKILKPEEVNWASYDELQKFAPFGKENPRPLFSFKDIEVKEKRIVGKNGGHLKLKLEAPMPAGRHKDSMLKTFIFEAIGFNFAKKTQELKNGDRVDLVFEIMADEYNGQRKLQLKIIDLKKHG